MLDHIKHVFQAWASNLVVFRNVDAASAVHDTSALAERLHGRAKQLYLRGGHGGQQFKHWCKGHTSRTTWQLIRLQDFLLLIKRGHMAHAGGAVNKPVK